MSGRTQLIEIKRLTPSVYPPALDAGCDARGGPADPVVLMPSAPSSRLLATLPSSLLLRTALRWHFWSRSPPATILAEGECVLPRPRRAAHTGVAGQRRGCNALWPGCTHVTCTPQPAGHGAPRQQMTPLFPAGVTFVISGPLICRLPGPASAGRPARVRGAQPSVPQQPPHQAETRSGLCQGQTGRPWTRIWPLRLGFPICKQGGL